MSDANHTPDPTPDELEAVRALLASLGDEPLPADVGARLGRVLDAQLPAAGELPERARRPWLRVWLPRLALPVAAAVVIVAIAVSRSGGGSVGESANGASSAASAAAATATADAAIEAAPAAGGAAGAEAASSAAAGGAAGGEAFLLSREAAKVADAAKRAPEAAASSMASSVGEAPVATAAQTAADAGTTAAAASGVEMASAPGAAPVLDAVPLPDGAALLDEVTAAADGRSGTTRTYALADGTGEADVRSFLGTRLPALGWTQSGTATWTLADGTELGVAVVGHVLAITALLPA